MGEWVGVGWYGRERGGGKGNTGIRAVPVGAGKDGGGGFLGGDGRWW